MTGIGPVGTDDAWRWASGFGMDGWEPGRWFSNPSHIENPNVKRIQMRQDMLDRRIESALRRQTTLNGTAGVPAGALSAIAVELKELRDIDSADESYWGSADYDPAREEDEDPVSVQLARVPGIETIVTVISADDHS